MIGFNKKMNEKEMQEFAKYILSDACKKTGLDVNIIVTKANKFYKTKKYKERYKDENLENITGLASAENKEIIIITDNLDANYEIVDYVFSIFHELMHIAYAQKEIKAEEYDLAMFSVDLENDIINHNETRYSKYHDMFFEEIVADSFSITMTREQGMKKVIEYMNEKNKPLSKKQINMCNIYLDYLDLYVKYRLNAHNVSISIDYFNSLIQENPNILANANSILKKFYKKDGTYRSLIDIMNDTELNNYPFEIRSYILSSRSFLKEVDFNNISYFQLAYLLKSIEYVYNDTLIKSKNCQKIKNTYKRHNYGKQKNILDNIEEEYFKDLNWVNTSNKRQNYLKKILDKYKYSKTSTNPKKH